MPVWALDAAHFIEGSLDVAPGATQMVCSFIKLALASALSCCTCEVFRRSYFLRAFRMGRQVILSHRAHDRSKLVSILLHRTRIGTESAGFTDEDPGFDDGGGTCVNFVTLLT